MNEDEDNLLKYAAIAGAAFLIWKNWQTIGPYLGFTPTFTDIPSLQAYAQANPTKNAAYNGVTATGAAWLAELGTPAPAPPPQSTATTTGTSGIPEDKWDPPKPWTSQSRPN